MFCDFACDNESVFTRGCVHSFVWIVFELSHGIARSSSRGITFSLSREIACNLKHGFLHFLAGLNETQLFRATSSTFSLVDNWMRVIF